MDERIFGSDFEFINDSTKESLFYSLFHNSSDAIFIMNEKVFLDCNLATLKIFACEEKSQIVGHSPIEFSPKVQKDGALSSDKAREKIISVLKHGEEVFHWQHLTRKGDVFDAEVRLNRVEINNVIYIQVVVKDLSELSFAKKMVLESESKYKTLFDVSPMALGVFDYSGNLIASNRAALELFGFTDEQIVGVNLKDHIVNKSDYDALNEQLSKTGKVKDLNILFRRANGTKFYVNANVNIYSVGDNNYILGQAMDVTEKRENELQEAFFNAISQTILNNAPDEDFYALIYQQVNEIFDIDSFVIGLLSDEKDKLNIVFNHGEKKIKEFPITKTFSEYVVKNNKSLFLQAEEIVEFKLEHNLNTIGKPSTSWLGVPLRDSTDVIGLLIIQEFKEDTLVTDFEIRLIEILANTIGLSISRREVNKTLRMLSSSVDQSPAMVMITDRNGVIEYVNRHFCTTTGYEPDEIIGKNPKILKSGLTDLETYQSLWTTISDGDQWKGSIINKKKDGSMYWEDIHISPFLDDSGEISHFIAVKVDISDNIKHQNELISAKEKAEESERLKTAFLSTMSHELRTPLNAVIGFSDILQDELGESDSLGEAVSIIRKSGYSLLDIIDDIFDLISIESGDVKVVKDVFNVNQFIKNCFLDLKEEQQRINPNLNVSLKAGDGIYNLEINSDESKIKKVLKHLFSNALKFTPSGQVEFGAYLQLKDIVFYVKDSGIGISKSKHKVIFERFRQADDTNTREYGGTGIGLSISKEMVSLLGGKIWLDSSPGSGSTFFLSLPVNTVKKETEPTSNTVSYENYTILVAEDEEYNFYFLEAVLKTTKAKVLWAKDGLEVIDLVYSNKVDLILMDLKMTKFDGFETTKKLRSEGYTMPIIAQTALAMKGDKEKALDAGCDTYLSKPLSKAKIISEINRLLS
jgi:PAS domain S-box-containing protein